MNRKADELLDYLLDVDGRKPAKAKPRYFYGDRAGADIDPTRHTHITDIPEEQFWNPEEAKKQ